MINQHTNNYLTYTPPVSDMVGSAKGSWEFELNSHQLFWSDRQFALYGYRPNELELNDDYFIKRTTHSSEIKRITTIIQTAIKSGDQYYFKRRILKKDGSLGFVETSATIIRSTCGRAKKIIGTSRDLQQTKQTPEDYNDPRFFNTLFKNYQKSIRAEVSKLVQNVQLGDDLCQEIFIKAWNCMSQYDPGKGQLFTWLLTIAKNHCKDYFKSRLCRENKLSLFNLPDLAESENENDFDQKGMYVRELLFQLTIEQRELIELLFIQGYSQSEVAKLKGMPLGTIKTKSRTALLILKKLVTEPQLNFGFRISA